MPSIQPLPLRLAAATVVAAAAALGALACASSGTNARRTVPADTLAMMRAHPVEFRNGSVLLAATLYLPPGSGPHPAVVMTQGSGPETRDVNRALAEVFATAGVAALTYDKRGTGSSSGDWKTASFADLAADAAAGAIALRARRDVDGTRVGVYAHGEGATWLPMIAERDATIAFLVAVGASGVQTDSLDRRHYDASGHWQFVNAAVMLAWGANDRRVPVAQSRAAIVDALKHLKHQEPKVLLVCSYAGADESLGGATEGVTGGGRATAPLLPAFVQDVAHWVREATRLDRPATAAERRYSAACS